MSNHHLVNQKPTRTDLQSSMASKSSSGHDDDPNLEFFHHRGDTSIPVSDTSADDFSSRRRQHEHREYDKKKKKRKNRSKKSRSSSYESGGGVDHEGVTSTMFDEQDDLIRKMGEVGELTPSGESRTTSRRMTSKWGTDWNEELISVSNKSSTAIAVSEKELQFVDFSGLNIGSGKKSSSSSKCSQSIDDSLDPIDVFQTIDEQEIELTSSTKINHSGRSSSRRRSSKKHSSSSSSSKKPKKGKSSSSRSSSKDIVTCPQSIRSSTASSSLYSISEQSKESIAKFDSLAPTNNFQSVDSRSGGGIPVGENWEAFADFSSVPSTAAQWTPTTAHVTSFPTSPTRESARARRTSKLEYLDQANAERDTAANSSTLARGGASNQATAGRASLSLAPVPNPPAPRFRYERADAPGAVEMEGRAFGAPRRAEKLADSENVNGPVKSPTDFFHSGTVEEHMVVEALAVDVKEEKELAVVYADSSPLTLKHMLREKKMRRFFCLGLALVIGAIAGTIAYFQLRPGNSGERETEFPTTSPTMSPTFFRDDILAIATELSGVEALEMFRSPQRKAVGWLSSKDQFDVEDEDFKQRYCMVAFAYSLNYDQWLDQESWLDPTLHECEWSVGIKCAVDGSGRRIVIELDATRNGLSGRFPLELCGLNRLEVLKLPKNPAITGTLPTAIGLLSRLATLNLESTDLEGTLPQGIGKATDLVSINLSGNSFSGSLPDSIYNLKGMRFLDFSSNKFIGSISDKLSQLSFTLTSLDLSHNALTGTLPDVLEQTTKLDYLRLDHNFLTGSLPKFSVGMANIMEFTASNNLFTGLLVMDPEFVSADRLDRVRLFMVDFSNNLLTGTLPETIAVVPSIKHIDLSANEFVGSLPVTTGFERLEHFSVASNKLTGTVRGEWPKSLHHFDVAKNFFTGTFPEGLCNAEELSFVMFGFVPELSGTIPRCIGNLRKMRKFGVRNCSLFGPIPSEMGLLTDMDIIQLSNNQFTGTIPPEIGNIHILDQLFIGGNKLTGSIPTEFGNLKLIWNLDLSSNQLTGTVPYALGKLTKLKSLLISNNPMIGSIPGEVCYLASTQALNITGEDVGCNLRCECCDPACSTASNKQIFIRGV